MSGHGDDPGRLSFSGAVLVAASPFPTGRATPPPTLHRFGAQPRLRDAVFVATGRPRLALEALQSQRSSFTASAADLYAWPLRPVSRRRAMVDLARLAGDRGARLRAAEWLLDFPGPVGLVWGHRDPLMTGEDFAALERELPYARIWRTEAGHFVQEEEPDAIVEAIEWTAQRIGIAPEPEGIPANFLPGIGSGDYVEVGRSQVRRLIDHAGLRPSDRILDVGCGLGRTARALRETMSPAGRYDGVDVVRDVVRWCQQNLTRVDRRLRFHHAPVRSGLYSPQGSVDAREYRFPFEDESFDFVIAESLFTHLSAEEARSYLAEIGRVMRPGATLCVSVFLLDSAAREAIAAGTKRPPLCHRARRRVDRGSRATAARGRVRRRLVHERARCRGSRDRRGRSLWGPGAARSTPCRTRTPWSRPSDADVSLGAERTAKLGALLRVEAAAPGAFTAIGPTKNDRPRKPAWNRIQDRPIKPTACQNVISRSPNSSGMSQFHKWSTADPNPTTAINRNTATSAATTDERLMTALLERFEVHRRRPAAALAALGRRKRLTGQQGVHVLAGLRRDRLEAHTVDFVGDEDQALLRPEARRALRAAVR